MTQIEKTAASIRKVVVGVIIAEYGLRELNDGSKQDLKQTTSFAINSCKRVQDYFKYHPQSTPEYKEIFEKEFLKSELFMLSELVELCWGFNDDALEEIINAIKSTQMEANAV